MGGVAGGRNHPTHFCQEYIIQEETYLAEVYFYDYDVDIVRLLKITHTCILDFVTC